MNKLPMTQWVLDLRITPANKWLRLALGWAASLIVNTIALELDLFGRHWLAAGVVGASAFVSFNCAVINLILWHRAREVQKDLAY